jgi:hypothetical protein
MIPPLYLDYIPVLIMKRIEFENIYSVFHPITYTMSKYNREKLASRWLKKSFTHGVCTASGGAMAISKLRHNIQQKK